MLSNLFTNLHNLTSSLYNYNLMFKHTHARVYIYIESYTHKLIH